jgi:hypothetical protein
MESDAVILQMMTDLLKALRAAKPEDRNEVARRYAITITEMEKLAAYFKVCVIGGEDWR